MATSPDNFAWLFDHAIEWSATTDHRFPYHAECKGMALRLYRYEEDSYMVYVGDTARLALFVWPPAWTRPGPPPPWSPPNVPPRRFVF